MNYNKLIKPSVENDYWLFRFKAGDEAALNKMYGITYTSLSYRGKMLVRDDFVVETTIQEALLKVWNMRERMESLYHIYRFMRMHVTWGCLNHHRTAATRFQRNIVYTEYIEYYKDTSDELCEAQHFDSERMQRIEAVLPYLSPTRQTIMDLYFRHGLSYKKIARRFGSSSHKVSIEVQKSLELIRKVLHEKKRCVQFPSTSVLRVCPPSNETLDLETWQIFKWRYEMKLGFDTIANKLNRPKEYVQHRYIEAHRYVQSLKVPSKKKANLYHRFLPTKSQTIAAYEDR